MSRERAILGRTGPSPTRGYSAMDARFVFDRLASVCIDVGVFDFRGAIESCCPDVDSPASRTTNRVTGNGARVAILFAPPDPPDVSDFCRRGGCPPFSFFRISKDFWTS